MIEGWGIERVLLPQSVSVSFHGLVGGLFERSEPREWLNSVVDC